MSTKVHSPAANLLRNSRLFSLPPPLPRPAEQVQRTPETATLPYPTFAAITTPTSSLVRGDWGLKRPLPLKSTRATTTPVIRIGPVDNIVHITEFASAADTAITLKKWQELAVPMSNAASTARGSRSFFDVHDPFRWDLDRTTAPPKGTAPTARAHRWRFSSPWIAGMSEAEFVQHLATTIRRRKDEFREYLRSKARTERAQSRHTYMTEQDGSASGGGEEVTDQELDEYIRRLRDRDQTLRSSIATFLDLPEAATDGHRSTDSDRADLDRGYAETGPPRTHPSAGLSYLRTGAVLTNDPLRGPLEGPPPVEARVIRPMHSTSGQKITQFLGVAGVVSDNIMSAMGSKSKTSPIDPDVHGGQKMWVRPTRVSVDSKGRIKVRVEPTESDASSVSSSSSSSSAIDSFRRSRDAPTPAWPSRPSVQPPPSLRGPNPHPYGLSGRRGAGERGAAAAAATGGGGGSESEPRTSSRQPGSTVSLSPQSLRSIVDL
ncbi:MAG: hypothetical protein M1815_004762 [Lichina confinis]|nr:MAG: hypothetical protein M1815_004762 [Lichina confinis]